MRGFAIVAAFLAAIISATNGNAADADTVTGGGGASVEPPPSLSDVEHQELHEKSVLARLEAEVKRGSVEAHVTLGLAHDHGDLGLPKNPSAAAMFWHYAADQGHPDGQAYLGHALMHGDGVTMDYGRAAKYFHAAGEQGILLAQNNLGFMFMHGMGMDCEKMDCSAEAIKWYQKAAEQGDTVAAKSLAHIYEHGLGVDKDEEEANKWRAHHEPDSEL